MEERKFNSVNIDSDAFEKETKVVSNVEKKSTFDVKNYLNLRLAPNETEKTVRVRVLPVSSTDGSPFVVVKMHPLKVNKEVSKSGFKSLICLNDVHVGTNDCPICARVKSLFEKGNEAKAEYERLTQEGKIEEANNKLQLSKTLFREGYSWKTKKAYIMRVIDRDHEDEGVKFWKFNENSNGKGVLDALMGLKKTRNDESIKEGDGEYNIFDLYNGKDIIINIKKTEISDGKGGVRKVDALNITDSGNRKPLSKDVDLANKWLSDTKGWKDVYAVKTADFMEVVMEGGVPVYNNEMGRHVAKTTSLGQPKSEIREEDFVKDDVHQEIAPNNDSDYEELPF